MILAIETSASLCSVVFWEEGKIIKEFNSDAPMQHSKLLGGFIEAGLKEIKKDPNLVAVAIGPGSFTGLRIGLSYAQGLCFGKNIAVVGVSNHQALAMQNTISSKNLFTAIDARRDELYIAKHCINDTFDIISHEIVAIENLDSFLPENSTLILYEDVKIDNTGDQVFLILKP